MAGFGLEGHPGEAPWANEKDLEELLEQVFNTTEGDECVNDFREDTADDTFQCEGVASPVPAKRPPRPQNAFMIFGRVRRKQLQQEHPDLANIRISQILGHEWKMMDGERKAMYFTVARKTRDEFFREHPDYKYTRRPNRNKKRNVPKPKKKNSPTFRSPVPILPAGMRAQIGWANGDNSEANSPEPGGDNCQTSLEESLLETAQGDEDYMYSLQDPVQVAKLFQQHPPGGSSCTAAPDHTAAGAFHASSDNSGVRSRVASPAADMSAPTHTSHLSPAMLASSGAGGQHASGHQHANLQVQIPADTEEEGGPDPFEGLSEADQVALAEQVFSSYQLQLIRKMSRSTALSALATASAGPLSQHHQHQLFDGQLAQLMAMSPAIKPEPLSQSQTPYSYVSGSSSSGQTSVASSPAASLGGSRCSSFQLATSPGHQHMHQPWDGLPKPQPQQQQQHPMFSLQAFMHAAAAAAAASSNMTNRSGSNSNNTTMRSPALHPMSFSSNSCPDAMQQQQQHHSGSVFTLGGSSSSLNPTLLTVSGTTDAKSASNNSHDASRAPTPTHPPKSFTPLLGSMTAATGAQTHRPATPVPTVFQLSSAMGCVQSPSMSFQNQNQGEDQSGNVCRVMSNQAKASGGQSSAVANGAPGACGEGGGAVARGIFDMLSEAAGGAGMSANHTGQCGGTGANARNAGGGAATTGMFAPLQPHHFGCGEDGEASLASLGGFSLDESCCGMAMPSPDMTSASMSINQEEGVEACAAASPSMTGSLHSPPPQAQLNPLKRRYSVESEQPAHALHTNGRSSVDAGHESGSIRLLRRCASTTVTSRCGTPSSVTSSPGPGPCSNPSGQGQSGQHQPQQLRCGRRHSVGSDWDGVGVGVGLGGTGPGAGAVQTAPLIYQTLQKRRHSLTGMPALALPPNQNHPYAFVGFGKGQHVQQQQAGMTGTCDGLAMMKAVGGDVDMASTVTSPPSTTTSLNLNTAAEFSTVDLRQLEQEIANGGFPSPHLLSRLGLLGTCSQHI